MVGTTRLTLPKRTPTNSVRCWTPTSRRVARWAARAGVAVVPVLLQTWIPRPCALGLLRRGTRSAIADGSLLRSSTHTVRLGISPYSEAEPGAAFLDAGIG